MFVIIRKYLLPIVLIFSATTVAGESIIVDVRNQLAIDRQGEVVVVHWSDIKHLMPEARPSTLVVYDGTRGIQSQAIDNDMDGAIDDIAFQVSLKAHASKSFTLKEGTQVVPTPLTDARFVLPREDLAWESDRIAFRMYGPALAAEVNNGIDVWTKRVSYPIVAKWYKADEGNTSGKDSYHEDHGEGADFFTVGRSLGCGGCALWTGDSLLQPGVFATHSVIATGPIRAIFKLTYPEVSYKGMRVGETLRITLDAGQNLNRIEVTFTGNQPAHELQFAAGIVKRPNTVATLDEKRCLGGLYGLTTDDTTNGYLGTGIVFLPSSCSGVRESGNHLLIFGNAAPGKAVTYYAGAGWSRHGRFLTGAEWNNYLKDSSMKIASPLVVTVKANKH